MELAEAIGKTNYYEIKTEERMLETSAKIGTTRQLTVAYENYPPYFQVFSNGTRFTKIILLLVIISLLFFYQH